MAAGTPTSPEVLREIVQNVLVKPLEDKSVFLSDPATRTFDTDGSPVRVPKLNDDTTEPEFVAENTPIPDTYKPDFSEVLLMPRTLRGVKEISRFSNELMRQSVVNLEATVRERLIRRISMKLEDAFVNGDGGADADGNRTEPLGILSQPGTQAMGAVGALALDDLHDAVGLAMASDVDASRLKWFLRSDTFVDLRKAKDGDGRYLITPDPTEAGQFRLLGHQVVISNRLPVTGATGSEKTSVILADMSTVAIARDQNPAVKVLDERYAEYDQIGIRAVVRYDIGLLLPEAVVVLRGVNA